MIIERRAYDFPWTQGIFSDCLRAGYCAWCLELRGRLLAYCVMSVAAGEAHILNLCVDPAYHGIGMGGRLLTHMTKVASGHGVDHVLLEVRPSNLAAIALYHRMGFNKIGERPGYYPAGGGREDADVMILQL